MKLSAERVGGWLVWAVLILSVVGAAFGAAIEALDFYKGWR